MTRSSLALRSKIHLTVLAAALVVVLSLLDYRTGPAILFSIFYLLPVLVVSCYVGRLGGVIISFTSAAAWIAQNPAATQGIMRYWNALVLFGFYVITALILSTVQRSYEDAQKNCGVDFLTGIANSRAFQELAHREKLRASRYHRPLTIAYLDMDDFKEVNDQFGHATGDKVLVSVAHAIRDTLRDTDIVARIGGDEFVVLLPETGFDAAAVVLNKIRRVLSELMLSYECRVTFSIGAATFLSQPETVEELVRRADVAMYTAKRGGKNQIVHEQIGTKPAEGPKLVKSTTA